MSSRLLAHVALLSLVGSLAGCPTPPDEGPAGPPAGEMGGPPPAPGGEPGAQPPGEGAGTPPGGAEGGGMVNPNELKFSRFIEAGKETVTITVKVEGAEKGQIDIQSLGEKDGRPVPTVLHVEPFTGNTPVVITAPATYAEPLYVSAMVQADKPADPASGPPVLTKDQIGGVAEPVKLEGKNLDVTVKIGQVPKWLDTLVTQAATPPDGAAPGAPPPAGAPPPGDKAPPAGAPPAGAPPAGAPPAGEAPPAGAPPK